MLIFNRKRATKEVCKQKTKRIDRQLMISAKAEDILTQEMYKREVAGLPI